MRFWFIVLLLAGCGTPSTPDGGLPDAGVVRDAGADAGAVDAGQDGGIVDGGVRDAGTPDAGTPDAGTPDAGSPPDGGAFCTPCVTSSDCQPGAFCRGGATPRCSQDCAGSNTCPGTASCEFVHLGMGPLLGQTCNPDDTSCGAYVIPTTLSCTDTWANYGQRFFGTACTGACHRHDTEWPTPADVLTAADSIRLAVETGNMPQGSPLTPQERLQLLTWMACGAP